MNELLLIIRKTVRKKDDAEAAQAATDAKEYLFKVRPRPVLPLARAGRTLMPLAPLTLLTPAPTLGLRRARYG